MFSGLPLVVFCILLTPAAWANRKDPCDRITKTYLSTKKERSRLIQSIEVDQAALSKLNKHSLQYQRKIGPYFKKLDAYAQEEADLKADELAFQTEIDL